MEVKGGKRNQEIDDPDRIVWRDPTTEVLLRINSPNRTLWYPTTRETGIYGKRLGFSSFWDEKPKMRGEGRERIVWEREGWRRGKERRKSIVERKSEGKSRERPLQGKKKKKECRRPESHGGWSQKEEEGRETGLRSHATAKTEANKVKKFIFLSFHLYFPSIAFLFHTN